VPRSVPQVAVPGAGVGPRFEVCGVRRRAAWLRRVDERPPDDVGSPLDLDAGAEGLSHFSTDSVIARIVMAAIVSSRTSGTSPNPSQSDT
jgi:hypothetical protein